jgi:hypothetical protein
VVGGHHIGEHAQAEALCGLVKGSALDSCISLPSIPPRGVYTESIPRGSYRHRSE